MGIQKQFNIKEKFKSILWFTNGVGFGCPSKLTQPNPTKWKMGKQFMGVKIIRQLLLYNHKKKINK